MFARNTRTLTIGQSTALKEAPDSAVPLDAGQILCHERWGGLLRQYDGLRTPQRLPRPGKYPDDY